MNREYKRIAANCARKGKSRLELISYFPKASLEELQELNQFYEFSKEIINLTTYKDLNFIKKFIRESRYDMEDLDIILNKEKPMNETIPEKSSNSIFVLLSLLIFGLIILAVFSSLTAEFFKNEHTVTGVIYGEDITFSDLKITSNQTLKNIEINENMYSFVMRCSKGLTISFSKKGFVPIHKNINCEEQKLDIILAPMKEFVKLDIENENSIEDQGVKLELKGSDLVIIGTNQPAINPSISVTGFNPNTPGDMQYFPGELEGETSSGEITALESYGFAKIIAEDENGNSLDFSEGKSAKITFTIDPNQIENAPEEMPLWYFDEIKGTWIEEGLAKKVCIGNTCEYIGEMNKVRSWWNADHPVPRIIKEIKDWKAEREKCPKEKPQKIFGQNNKANKYICCTEDTKKEDVVFNEGVPEKCSCPTDKPNNLKYTLLGNTTSICCPIDEIVARRETMYVFGLGISKDFCGICDYGILRNGQKQICKSDYCSICVGEKLMRLKKSQSGTSCEEEELFDCGESGKVCVEHIDQPYSDPKARCEDCPLSLHFVLADDGEFPETHDDHAFFYLKYPEVENTENTLFGYDTVESVFNKISSVCNVCKNKGRFLTVILNSHGVDTGGIQLLGDRLDISYFNNLEKEIYNFSCVEKVVYTGCSVGKGAKGGNFLSASSNSFGAPSYGSTSVTAGLGSYGADFTLGLIKEKKPNNSPVDLKTIFYSTDENLFFPGIPSEAYQTKILEGELGEVLISITSSDPKRTEFISVDDENIFCPYIIKDSKVFELNSTSTIINYNNFNIELLKNSIKPNKKVKLEINLLDINCTAFENEYWELPKRIDSKYFEEIKKAFELGLVTQENFNKTKTLYDNNWLCSEDSDCFGPCPMGDLNCSYECNVDHECRVKGDFSNARFVPSTSVVESDFVEECSSCSNILSPENKYNFLIFSQTIEKINVRFEDIGEKISLSYAGILAPNVSFSINNVPSLPQNIGQLPSTGAIFSDYVLSNCTLWSGYSAELADCIIGYSSLFGLDKNEALDFISKLDSKENNLGIIYTKVADFYDEISFCYPVLKSDYYSGLACIKIVDEKKEVDSNINIKEILKQSLADYELSLVLRNLSEYYWDINYCYPIPTQSQKDACIGRFPKIPEIVTPVVLCGNGIIDNNEKCDGTNFKGLTCTDYGFDSGRLVCENCQISKKDCYNSSGPIDSTQICGNNIIEGNEDCDGTNMDGHTCTDYGFNSGNLVCENCRISTSNCITLPAQVCNDGKIEGTEQCEGTNFNDKTCQDFGFNSGTLSCTNCQISAKNCVNIVAPPVEIDPLEIFDCPYNDNYSSPVKDTVNNLFWIKVFKDSKILAYKVPFNKSNCMNETALNEDETGKIIPCITQISDDDGCIIEKRELDTITETSNKYIQIGKYEQVYKQNPVDFVDNDGNIYFTIMNSGKQEFIKFNSNNTIKEKIQIYDSSDYDNRTIPSVMRAMASGNIIWVVLAGALHNVYVANDPSCGNVLGCFNNPYTTYSVTGTGDADMGASSYIDAYGFGTIFIAKDEISGNTLTKIKNKIPCYEDCRFTPFGGGYTGTAYLKPMSFDPTKMTYKEDGFGNLIVRTNEKILEYSVDSNNVDFPSNIR